MTRTSTAGRRHALSLVSLSPRATPPSAAPLLMPPLPAAHGRGRTRLCARTRWLCRSRAENHFRATRSAAHACAPAALFMCVCSHLHRCSLSCSPTPLVLLSLALTPALSSSEHLFSFDRCLSSRCRASTKCPASCSSRCCRASTRSPASRSVQTSSPSSQTKATKVSRCSSRGLAADRPRRSAAAARLVALCGVCRHSSRRRLWPACFCCA